MLNTIALRQDRAALIEKLRAKHDEATSRNGGPTPAEDSEMRGLEKTIVDIEGTIEREEKLQSAERELGKPMNGNGINVSARWEPNRLGNGVGNIGHETTSAVLKPDQSVRSYMQEKGMIRKPEFEGLTLGAFCRAMVTGARSDLERRALGEASDSTGGYGVPDAVSGAFIDKMRAAQVVVKAGAKTVPLDTDKTTVVRLASDPVATWRVENAAINVSDPTFQGVIFAPKSLAVIVQVSRELLEDSLNIEAMLEAAFSGSMALELDRAALVGSGISPEPQGINGLANVGSVTSAGTAADWDKYIEGLSALWTANENVCSAIVMHPRTLTTLSKMKTGIASDKTPLQKPPVLQDIPIMQTTSIPITLGGGGAESIVIMGNFARLMIGVRSALRVEVLKELYAANHQYGFVAHLRADIAIEHPESFAVLSGVTA